jgi:hypothetical protein
MSIQVDSSNPLQTLLVINGVSVLKLNQDGSVELPNAPVGTSGSRILTANQLPFTKVYSSPEQPIVANGVVDLTHGLGTVPKLVQGFLVCKSAEYGYNVGDVVPVDLGNQGTNTLSWGVALSMTDTVVNFRYSGTATSFLLLNKTTTSSVQITNANWRLVVRAYA